MAITINRHGFNLDQQQMLLGYANGKSSHTLAREIGCSGSELRTIELDARARLQAKTTAHMMSRAWELGVLRRALCVMLMMLSMPATDDVMRIARVRSSRTPQTIARIRTGCVGRNCEA